jgi:crotonobetainyl-CoA:carnitine CoA-transferase CaiB-like acyl-CoA transferase
MRGACVIDLSADVAGAYCARVLASAGADVLKVEPPGGDPLRHAAPVVSILPNQAPTSTMFAYLNAYKRGLALDTTSVTGRTVLGRLIGNADAVISSFAGEEQLEETLRLQTLIAEANPGCVHTVTSPYGLSGPYRGYQASDLTDWAVSGYLQITGDPDREPLQGAGPWCGYATGLTAAVATAAALRYSRKTGTGQLVDVGAMEAMAGLHQWSLVLFTHQGVVKRRAGNRHAESFHPLGLQPCKDGSVCMAVSSVQHWESFCIAIGMPELLLDDRLASGGGRFDHADEVDAVIRPWLAARTRDEIVSVLQAHRIPAASVLTMSEVLAEPLLNERGFWVMAGQFGERARMPGVSFQTSQTSQTSESQPQFQPAPTLGQHSIEVLRNLGLERAEIDRLVLAGVVGAGARCGETGVAG